MLKSEAKHRGINVHKLQRTWRKHKRGALSKMTNRVCYHSGKPRKSKLSPENHVCYLLPCSAWVPHYLFGRLHPSFNQTILKIVYEQFTGKNTSDTNIPPFLSLFSHGCLPCARTCLQDWVLFRETSHRNRFVKVPQYFLFFQVPWHFAFVYFSPPPSPPPFNVAWKARTQIPSSSAVQQK